MRTPEIPLLSTKISRRRLITASATLAAAGLILPSGEAQASFDNDGDLNIALGAILKTSSADLVQGEITVSLNAEHRPTFAPLTNQPFTLARLLNPYSAPQNTEVLKLPWLARGFGDDETAFLVFTSPLAEGRWVFVPLNPNNREEITVNGQPFDGQNLNSFQTIRPRIDPISVPINPYTTPSEIWTSGNPRTRVMYSKRSG